MQEIGCYVQTLRNSISVQCAHVRKKQFIPIWSLRHVNAHINTIPLFSVHVNTTFRFINRNEFRPIEPQVVHTNVASSHSLWNYMILEWVNNDFIFIFGCTNLFKFLLNVAVVVVVFSLLLCTLSFSLSLSLHVCLMNKLSNLEQMLISAQSHPVCPHLSL